MEVCLTPNSQLFSTTLYNDKLTQEQVLRVLRCAECQHLHKNLESSVRWVRFLTFSLVSGPEVQRIQETVTYIISEDPA